jgi:hypothetical protein
MPADVRRSVEKFHWIEMVSVMGRKKGAREGLLGFI